MKTYCAIPEPETLATQEEIGERLTELFKAFGGEYCGGGSGCDSALFRVKLPGRYLAFAIDMPDLYDWLFFKESPAELQAACADDEYYQPMRCFPGQVVDAWNRLLLHRASHMLAAIATKLSWVDAPASAFNGYGSFDELFPSFVFEFNNYGRLELNCSQPAEMPQETANLAF